MIKVGIEMNGVLRDTVTKFRVQVPSGTSEY